VPELGSKERLTVPGLPLRLESIVLAVSVTEIGEPKDYCQFGLLGMGKLDSI
jgi:hypothetical protein